MCELEHECPECNGKGWSFNDLYSREMECRICDGFGKIPTEFGEQLLEFLSKRLKIKVNIT